MKQIADLMLLVFVVSCVLSVGLSLTVSQILAPLRQTRLVVFSLVVNFVVVPVLAVAITKMLSLSEPAKIGLLLLGSAAGAPFLPKIIEVVKGDVAFSVALMALLMLASLAYMPLVLPLMLPGVSVNSMGIAQSLLVTMILPLSIGLCIKARRESLAVRLRPMVSGLSNVSMMIALVLIPVVNFQILLELLSLQILVVSILFVGLSFAAGYVLGGTGNEARRVMGFGAAARNIPAALLVARENFVDPKVMIMVIVVALLSLIVLAPLAIVFARGNRSQTQPS
ncbi:MAG TPA: hypothetical protein PLR25_14420 [Planctomycetaceae bacterium]|nr:hypothetical protein [Planctomycetaceae bacterium]